MPNQLNIESAFDEVNFMDLLQDVRVISFDFFDTLFLRKIFKPEDVFDLIAEKYNIPDFRDIRINAQKEAFIRMKKTGNKEITLDDIYSCFPENLSLVPLKEAELEIESLLLIPNPELFPLFVKLINDPRFEVVITSDMYLNQGFFSAVLEPHLDMHVELFISCDEQATKRDSGELFSILVDKFEVSPEQILHIGDNYDSDYIKAKNKNLKAFHYIYQNQNVSTPVKQTTYQPNLGRSFIKGLFLADRPKSDILTPKQAGFLYGGSANLGFLRWVAEQTSHDNIDLILFLSRDGFTAYKMSEKGLMASEIPFSYFVGSRTAFTLAAITPENFAHYIDFLVSGSYGLKVEEVFERIGVAPPPRKLLTDIGFSEDFTVTESSLPDIKTLFYAMRKKILKVADENRRALYLYIVDVGISSGNRIALVDVGWSGSSQESFESALKQMIDVEVYGYYFCLAENDEKNRRQKNGMVMKSLFNSDVLSAKTLQEIYRNREVIELFFSAPEDTVIGYNLKANFDVLYVRDQGRGATALNTKSVVLEILNGALDFSRKCTEVELALGVNLNFQELCFELIDFAISSDSDNFFSANGIRNFDAWGSSRTSVQNTSF
ncbi:hypothetical protein [Vreelandella sulfidaeris]|uniref:hypothetical protein n=1 Tax=Vreelandella sulfidaeris TaxID=115553 RepID=UPI0035ED41D8